MIRGVFAFLLPAIAAYGQPLPLEGIAHVGFRMSDGVVFPSSGFVYVSAGNRGSPLRRHSIAWNAGRYSIRRR